MRTLIYTIILLILSSYSYSQVNLDRVLNQRRHQVVCSDFSQDGKFIATGGLDSKIFIWNASNGEVIRELKGLKSFPLSLKFSQDDKYLISGGKDKNVTIWDVNTGSQINRLSNHKDDITSIAISSDNKFIASASKDRTIKIWSLQTGELIQNLTGHSREVMAVDFHPNSTRLISGSADGTIKIWNHITGQNTGTIKAHSGWIRTVAYSPNGNFIASGGDDNKINIWNAHSFELQNSILAHSGWVESIAFSPDGKYIVSGSHDNYLIMIEANTGMIVFNSEKQSYYVLSVAFNPNGKEFVSSSLYSDNLMVWNTSGLGIRPVLDEKNQQDKITVNRLKAKEDPKIEWISENMTETTNVSHRVKYKITSDYPIDNLIFYLNNERFSTEDNLFMMNPVLEDEKILFLNEGINTIKAEIFYIRGMKESEILNVIYKPEIEDIIVINNNDSIIITETETLNLITDSANKETQEKESNDITITKEIIEVITEPKTTETNINQKEEDITEIIQDDLADNKEVVKELEDLTTNIDVIKEEKTIIQEELVETKTISEITEEKKEITEAAIVSELAMLDFKNPVNPYRFALIIGNEDYSSYQIGLQKESDVEFAISDATTFREFAIKVLGVPQDNILFLTNARAIQMYDELQKVKNIIKALNGKAEIFFYYAGHGFPDEKTREPHIMPVDVTGTNLRFAIKINDLYKELTEYPSERITVFLDACFSGGARNVGLVSARAVRVRPQENLLSGNLVVFSASSESQSAHPYREKGHGIFTYFLLNKLKETKGDITYKELSDYLVETVGVRSAIINNTEQTPQTNVSPSAENKWHEWRILK